MQIRSFLVLALVFLTQASASAQSDGLKSSYTAAEVAEILAKSEAFCLRTLKRLSKGPLSTSLSTNGLPPLDPSQATYTLEELEELIQEQAVDCQKRLMLQELQQYSPGQYKRAKGVLKQRGGLRGRLRRGRRLAQTGLLPASEAG